MVKNVVPPWDNPAVNLYTMKDTRHTHTLRGDLLKRQKFF